MDTMSTIIARASSPARHPPDPRGAVPAGVSRGARRGRWSRRALCSAVSPVLVAHHSIGLVWLTHPCLLRWCSLTVRAACHSILLGAEARRLSGICRFHLHGLAIPHPHDLNR